jgi:putative alpha-1,2-mannosidase
LLTLLLSRPFFEKITLDLDVPSANGWRKRKLSIIAPGARTRPYIKSVTIDNIRIDKPIIKHAQLVGWESDLPEVKVVFEMSDKIEMWGNEKEVLEALGVATPLEMMDDQEVVLDTPLYEEL